MRAGTTRCTLCTQHFTNSPTKICRWCVKRGGPPASGGRKCKACGYRWPQPNMNGMCVRCYREAVDQRRLNDTAAALERQPPRRPPPPSRVAHRTIVVQGVEYVVAWDGGMDGAIAMGLPLGHERGAPPSATDVWRGEWRGPGRRFDDGGF